MPAKRPAASSDPARPAEMVSRRFGRRLRQLRAERTWSLETLAGRSGVSRSMISQIEREQANPTLAVTLRIAQAFGMPLAELVDAPGAAATVQVIRHDDRAYHYRSDEHCRLRTLSPLNLEKDVELYELKLEPGGALRSAPHFAGTREYLTVVSGSIRVESGGDSDVLLAGDSANYRADVSHSIVNESKGESLAILVVIYR